MKRNYMSFSKIMFTTESTNARKRSLRALLPSCVLSSVLDEIIDGATDAQMKSIERIVERTSKRSRIPVMSMCQRLGDSILETKVFPFLDMTEHMKLARTCHHVYKLSGCPPPPISYRRPAAWGKLIYIDEVDEFSLNKIADFMAPTGLDGCWWSNVDWSTLRRLSTLESLTVYIPENMFSTWDVENLKHIGNGLPALRYLALNGPFRDKEMEHLAGLTNLQHFKLDAQKMSGSGLSHLRGLPIRTLELGETIDPTSLIFLTDMPLTELHLRYDRLSDQHLMVLQAFKLRKLFIRTSFKIVGYGITYLYAMPLEILTISRAFRPRGYDVNWAVIDNDALPRLNCLTSLQCLALTYSAINDIGLHKLRLHRLRYISLLGCLSVNDNCLALFKDVLLRGLNVSGALAVTDEGIRQLADHPTLEVLGIRDTKLTKKCVPHLVSIPRLLSLDVDGAMQRLIMDMAPEFGEHKINNGEHTYAPAWFYY